MRTARWLVYVVVAGLLAGCASVKMRVDTGPVAARAFSFVAINPRSGTSLPVNEEKVHAAIQATLATGNLDQIKEDVEGCRRIGAHQLFFDPTFAHEGQSLERWLQWMEQLRKLG